MSSRLVYILNGVLLILLGFAIASLAWPLDAKGIPLVALVFSGMGLALAGIILIEAAVSKKVARRDAELGILDIVMRLFGR